MEARLTGMGDDRSDDFRSAARAKWARIEKTLSAIDALTPDEAEYVYVKLETKIVASRTGNAVAIGPVSVADETPQQSNTAN